MVGRASDTRLMKVRFFPSLLLEVLTTRLNKVQARFVGVRDNHPLGAKVFDGRSL